MGEECRAVVYGGVPKGEGQGATIRLRPSFSPLPPQQQSTHNVSLPVSCAPESSTSVAASQSANIPQEASATSPKKLASESGWLFSHGAQLASTYQTPRRRSWDLNLVRRIKRLWKLWSRRLRWWSEMGRAKSRWKTSDKISVGCKEETLDGIGVIDGED
jgi:hypothetical protein